LSVEMRVKCVRNRGDYRRGGEAAENRAREKRLNGFVSGEE